MKKQTAILLFFLLFIISSVSLSFGENITATDWKPLSGISGFSVRGDVLTFDSISAMPLLSTRNGMLLNANTNKYVRIKLKSDQPYGGGRMFFVRIGDQGPSYSNSVEIQNGRAGSLNTYVVDMGINPNWQGVVTALIYSPVSGSGKVELENVSLLEPSLPLYLCSRWQEFMRFEPYLPRSVNFIYGPKIGGSSVNIFAYWMIFIAALLSIGIRNLTIKAPKELFKVVARDIAIVMLVLWCLIDVRAALDNARTFAADRNMFAGKTLDEKRELTTPQDYYEFISFCMSKIPSGSSYGMINPEYYYYREKAAYYLYPTYYSDTPDYILVYDPMSALNDKLNEKINAGYRLFAKLKNGELILKK